MENHLITLSKQITCIIIKSCSKMYKTLLTLEESYRIYLTPIINILRENPVRYPLKISSSSRSSLVLVHERQKQMGSKIKGLILIRLAVHSAIFCFYMHFGAELGLHNIYLIS